jgi:hypothetical protein
MGCRALGAFEDSGGNLIALHQRSATGYFDCRVMIESIRVIFDRNDAKPLRVTEPSNGFALHGVILLFTGTLNVSNWRMDEKM